MHTLLKTLIATAILLLASSSFAEDDNVIGTWQTESSEKGYLHVAIDKCDDALCGSILGAFDLEGEPLADYEHIGKNMVWDMKSKGASSWSKGKIWDPSKDKTYKSKMTLSGDVLSVSGCVLVVCRSQNWTRVN